MQATDKGGNVLQVGARVRYAGTRYTVANIRKAGDYGYLVGLLIGSVASGIVFGHELEVDES